MRWREVTASRAAQDIGTSPSTVTEALKGLQEHLGATLFYRSGKGLTLTHKGHQFLRHIERTKVLIHLVDVSGASGRNPVEDFDTIRRELELYNPELVEKPQLVAANKIDVLDSEEQIQELASRSLALGLPFFKISAATGAGIPALLEAMWQRLALTPGVNVPNIEAPEKDAAPVKRSAKPRGVRRA